MSLRLVDDLIEDNQLLRMALSAECEVNFQHQAEIARLFAGGCARDQRLTQHCAEAARFAEENAKLRELLQRFYDDGYDRQACGAALKGTP